MAETILYIAMSVDGFIARENGAIDWLEAVEADAVASAEDYGYFPFYASVDAVLMGSATYEQVLGFGDWPYAGKPSIVFSQRGLVSEREDVVISAEVPETVLANLDAKRVWLVGGGVLNGSFLRAGLVDELIISIIPILLGSGIPLFVDGVERALKLVESRTYPSGLVQLRYR